MGTRLAVAAAIIALAAGDAHVAEAKPSEFCGVDWICSPTTREVCGENADGVQTTRNNKCEAHCYGEVVERDGACLADLQARFDACAKFKDQEVRPSPPLPLPLAGITAVSLTCNIVAMSSGMVSVVLVVVLECRREQEPPSYREPARGH